MSITRKELDNIVNEVNVLNLRVVDKIFKNGAITLTFGHKDKFSIRCYEIGTSNLIEELKKRYIDCCKKFYSYDLEMYRIKKRHEINKNYCINILTDNLNDIINGFRKPVKIEPVEFNPDLKEIEYGFIEEEIYKDEDLISRLEKCLEILKGE